MRLVQELECCLANQLPYLSFSCAGPFVSVDEVVALLVQVGLFDTAIDTALRFSIPLMPIFESLAAR